MQCLRIICDTIITKSIASKALNIQPVCGIKYFPPPKNYDDIEIPEKAKLRFMDKVPTMPGALKPPKMQKRLRYMRGPELIHNSFQHRQYGIVAECGGRLRFEHMELIRLGVTHKMDPRRMFAVWRVDPPWQPVTKKGQGMRMGGGKGSIDHYVTPVKAGRVIIELGGKCDFKEVYPFLRGIAARLPFRAVAISQDLMDKKAARKLECKEKNVNPYTMEYIIKNNMGGCHRWLSPVDHKWFGEYR